MKHDITTQDITCASSGRFLLRIEPALHAELRAAARETGLSLNEYCARRLAMPEAGFMDEGGASVRRALQLFGRDLIAVAAFGSWARGRAADTSDVDLLVVVEERVALGRQAYRSWDESPVTWSGRPVEPHLVHLPAAGQRVSGLWAEVALDGVILFEREYRLSRRLVPIRAAIAEGRLVRRRVHGQTYWVEAA